MPSTEPNEKNTLIVIKTIFIIILIYQIFWLGSEVQKLKQSVKTIQEIQSYLIEEAKENQRYKFIKI